MTDTPPAFGEWRDIESAPKDGTVFIAWCRENVERQGYIAPPSEDLCRMAFVWNGHPNPDQPRGVRWVSVDVQVESFDGSECTGGWNEYEWTPVNPTRWMPLPSPPKD